MIDVKYYRTLLEDCHNHVGHLRRDVVEEYFPQNDFDLKVDRFFHMRDDDLQRFVMMTYPFYGRQVLDPEFFNLIVSNMPEFLASIISLGVGSIITVMEHGEFSSDICELSPKRFADCAVNVFSMWILWEELDDGSDDARISESDLLSSLTSMKRGINIKMEHYDLLGCLQYHYNKFWCSSEILSNISPENIGPLVFQRDSVKSTLLNILCRDGVQPKRVYYFPSEDFSPESYLVFSHNYIDYENSLDILEEELKDDLFPDPDRDVRILQRMETIKHSKQLEVLFGQLKQKSIHIEEPATLYGNVNGLELQLPEDATTDQSSVFLHFLVDDKKIAKIKLSHMEAAFLFYLGSERKAGESYWLHAPNEHRELLLKIWNSFSLPQSFENELELESPQKDSNTWIWDFRNTNRKTLRNQIQRKIKYLYAEALDFNLITSIKPKSSSRGGNYKLNSQIKSFEIIPPSR